MGLLTFLSIRCRDRRAQMTSAICLTGSICSRVALSGGRIVKVFGAANPHHPTCSTAAPIVEGARARRDQHLDVRTAAALRVGSSRPVQVWARHRWP